MQNSHINIMLPMSIPGNILKMPLVIFVFIIHITAPHLNAQNADKLHELKEILHQTSNDTIRANTLFDLAKAVFYTDANEAIRYGKMATDAYSKINHKNGIARSSNVVGVAYFTLGNYILAEEHQLKANKLSKEVNDSEYIGKSFNNLGNLYQKQGLLDQSVDCYEKALKEYKTNNNTDGQLVVTNNIAAIFHTTGNYPKAIEYYSNALKAAQKLNDVLYQSTVLQNLSAIYTELGDYEKALEECTRSNQLLQHTDYYRLKVNNYISFGNIYNSLNNIAQSRSSYSMALEMAKTNGFKDEEAVILLHLGQLELQHGNLLVSKKHLNIGLELAETMQALEQIKEFHKYLYIADSTSNDYKSAIANLETYYTFDSKIAQHTPSGKLEELESKYLLTRQENITQSNKLKRNKWFIYFLTTAFVIVILSSIIFIQKTKLKARNKVTALTQENLRSQINPHFIFNVLNSIHAYIINNNKELSSCYLLKFAKLLRLTLDNSRSQLTTINDEIDALRLYLELETIRLGKEFEYNIQVDEEIDPLMFKIPPLLIQPYVENSIIHGIQNKEGKGKIQIRLDYADNLLHCSIEDNGIGRAAALKAKAAKHKSHGTKITENRIRLLNSLYGKKMNMNYIDLFDNEKHPNGTRVEFNLPILN